MYYIYAISSIKRKYIYVGISSDVNRRISQHQAKKEKTTAPYVPFKVLFIERSQTRTNARIREKYLKSGIGKEWIKKNFFDKM